MSFDAGAIVGKLGLDIGSFTGGLVGAGAAAGGFQSIIAATLVDPLLGVAAAAKEAAGALAELVTHFGESAAAMSLAAEKAGVSVEFLSRLAAVGEEVNVSTEQIGVGFKLLQRNAVDALEGNDKAAKSFTDLGLSMRFLKDHLADNEGLFEAVQAGLAGIDSPALRAQRAIEVFGRQGSELVPLLNMSGAAADKLADDLAQMGAVGTEHGAKLGREFKTLETYTEGAWKGIQKAVTTPILQYLSDHLDEILPRVMHFAEVAREFLGRIMDRIMPALEQAGPAIGEFFDHVVSYIESAGPSWVETIGKMADAVVSVLVPGLQQLERVLDVLLPILTTVAGASADILDVTGKLVGGLTSFGGVLGGGPVGGGAAPAGGGSTFTINVDAPVQLDGDQVANDVVNQLHPKVKAGVKQAVDEATANYRAGVSHAAAAKGIGGRHK